MGGPLPQSFASAWDRRNGPRYEPPATPRDSPAQEQDKKTKQLRFRTATAPPRGGPAIETGE
jgi:hypothetical protein